MSLDFWHSLFRELEVVESDAEEYGIDQNDFQYDTFSIEECNDFERASGLVLPQQYKEFCQVFGSGCFGNDFIEIHCPSDYWIHDANPSRLDCIRHSIENSPNTAINSQELIELINSAFVFGGLDYFGVFWDIRTYKTEDDSYDIYWALDECFEGEIFKVGRDFSEFIQGFCLGNELLRSLPAYFHSQIDGMLPVFKRYPRLPLEAYE